MGSPVTRSGEAMLRIRVTRYRGSPGADRITWYRRGQSQDQSYQDQVSPSGEYSNHVPMMPRQNQSHQVQMRHRWGAGSLVPGEAQLRTRATRAS